MLLLCSSYAAGACPPLHMRHTRSGDHAHICFDGGSPPPPFIHLFASACPACSEKEIFTSILRGQLDFQTSPWPSISPAAKGGHTELLQRAGLRGRAQAVGAALS